jgi:hypothetical protein
MSASKLAEQIGNKYLPTDNRFFRAEIEKALDEMALRVFEDTRERAAKQVTPYRSANAIRRAIRAMQPDGK